MSIGISLTRPFGAHGQGAGLKRPAPQAAAFGDVLTGVAIGLILGIIAWALSVLFITDLLS